MLRQWLTSPRSTECTANMPVICDISLRLGSEKVLRREGLRRGSEVRSKIRDLILELLS